MLNQSDKNAIQGADWRCAPQPLRFYSREKIAGKMTAARAMYAMRRTLGAASRRVRPMMEAMEREARLARPAGAASISDGLSALSGLSEKQLREKLLTRSQIVALCDQVFTAIGVAYMMGYDIAGALEEVCCSNESKFEDGGPVFDADGKIAKGRNYTTPDLKRFTRR